MSNWDCQPLDKEWNSIPNSHVGMTEFGQQKFFEWKLKNFGVSLQDVQFATALRLWAERRSALALRVRVSQA